jgi:hypothetical protein
MGEKRMGRFDDIRMNCLLIKAYSSNTGRVISNLFPAIKVIYH